MAHTLAHGLIVDDDGMSSSSGSPSSERDTAHVASDTGDTKGKQPPADVRRAKHREVQRRFIERKKVTTTVSLLFLPCPLSALAAAHRRKRWQ